MTASRIRPFARFYPYYLGEHRHPVCRGLHDFGSWVVLLAGGWVMWWQITTGTLPIRERRTRS